MLWTLHGYIIREMGKTFILTAIGLTALIGLGGGVVNMIGFEGMNLLDIFHIQQLILPLALTFSLPIAALFSATITYGRLSADNEFVACRASGINIHRLMFSALAISLFASGVGFMCFNYVFPNTMMNLEAMVKTNLERLVNHMVKSPKRLPFLKEKVRIYADGASTFKDGDMTYINLEGVVFSERQDGDWHRYGTSKTVEMTFDLSGDVPIAGATFYGLSWYDRERQQFIEEEFQIIEPYSIDKLMTGKSTNLKFLNLTELLDFSSHPWDLPQVKRDLSSLRRLISRTIFYEKLKAELETTRGPLHLGDDEVSLQLTFPDGVPSLELGEKGCKLTGTIHVIERLPDLVRELKAPAAEISFIIDSTTLKDRIRIQLVEGVDISTNRDPDDSFQRSEESLASFLMPEESVQEAESWNSRYLLSPDAELEKGDFIDLKHEKIAASYKMIKRKLAKEVHTRLALSISLFLLVLLGASLGIAFRGSHALTAFGISAVPTILMMVMIIMGRQLIAKETNTALLGIGIIWFSVIFVMVMNAIALMKLVRR